jgi:uncharacterized protein YjlB
MIRYFQCIILTRPFAKHSVAWEALLCVKGRANVQFGGEGGPVLEASVGDLLIVPPGVAHKQLQAWDGFTLLVSLGAPYPERY